MRRELLLKAVLECLEAEKCAFEAGGAELDADECFDIVRGDGQQIGDSFANTELGEHRCCCLANNAAGAVKAKIGQYVIGYKTIKMDTIAT